MPILHNLKPILKVELLHQEKDMNEVKSFFLCHKKILFFCDLEYKGDMSFFAINCLVTTPIKLDFTKIVISFPANAIDDFSFKGIA